MINHYVPSTIKEALEILSKHNCAILAGGTDLLLQKYRSSTLLPTFDKDVLYIKDIKELDYIKEDDKNLYIGAVTTYKELIDSPIVPSILKEVFLQIASPNIRNMATLVGNIGNASPAGDGIVPLYLMDATLKIESINGTRYELVSEFIKGIRKIDLQPNEFITEIIIPKHDLTYKFVKVGSRKVESISKVSFMGAYHINKGIVDDLRIAFGSVFITVSRSRAIEEKFIGCSISELKAKKHEILQEFAAIIKPITDQRSTQDYRYKVALNLLENFIEKME